MSHPLTSRKRSEVIAHGRDGPVTVGRLTAEAAALAERLPHSRYAINLHSDRLDYLRGFCAAMIAGHCTLMPPNREPETLRELEKAYPDSYRLGDPNNRDSAETHGADVAGEARTPDIEKERPAVIAFTSGSTGEATATEKSWYTLCRGTRNNHLSLLGNISSPIHLLATVPPQHMWGFEMTVLLPLMAPVAISRKSPFYPLDVAEALAALPEPRVLVSSPLHLRTLMNSGVAFPRLLRVYTATAPLDPAEAVRLEENFNTEVIDVFGCSESGIIAMKRTSREDRWHLTPPFTLESTASGTLIRAEHLAGDVFLPDQLELLDSRTFKWMGRHKDMINIAGKRGSLADLNTRLLRIEGVRDGVVFQPEGKHRLAAMVVAPELTAADIARGLKPQVDPVFIPRPICMVETLPRLETGKLARSDLLALFDTLRSGANSRNTGEASDQ